MRCAIMQPTYLPWLGYFELISKSDVFVIYDTVQFEKQSWQQRNKIRNKAGEIMLTVPVKHGSGLLRRINDVEIDYSENITRKHIQSIKQAYCKSVNFSLYFSKLEQIFTSQQKLLKDLNVALIRFGMDCFNIKTPLEFTSDLNVRGTKVEALIDICQKLHADQYLSPMGSKSYIEENNLFTQHNIQLSYQNYEHLVYQQMNYPDFISHLAFIDYLFNSNEVQTLKATTK